MSLNAPSEIKAYQFIAGKPASKPTQVDDDKENAPDASKAKGLASKPALALNERSSSPSKAFPSTPATRLPLADLIGDTEQHHADRAATDDSPEERIRWHTALSPRSSNTRVTPASRRKRLRSSSPPTTSQRSAAKRSRAENPPLDLEELKKSLRTPQTDPSADLWNRYTISSGKENAEGTSMLGLIASSSPHIFDEQAGNISGLRRWTSCGLEFPTSKSKRRKILHSAGTMQIAENFVVLPEAIKEEESLPAEKPTKIKNLLERLQNSVRPPVETASEPQAPSSSSPLPNRQEDFDRQSISPCRASELAARNGGKESQTTRKEMGAHRDEPKPHNLSAASSSFGSDAMGSDMMQVGAQDISLADEEHRASLDIPEAEASEVVHKGANDTAALPLPKVQDDDEEDFGGDDVFVEDDFGDAFDLSAENIDDVTSVIPQHQSGPQSAGLIAEPAKSLISAEGVGDDDDDDIDEELFAAAEYSATQSASSGKRGKSSSRHRKRAIQRYLVKHVQPSEYISSQGGTYPQKVVQVQEETDPAKRTKSIVLRGSWLDTRCTEGSFVHVIGDFNKHDQCIVDDAHNMLILHPDHLISALVVADSFGCMRKAVLQDRIKATNASSPPMLYGTVLHEIFQEAMQANRWGDDWLHDIIETIVKRHIEDLYQTGLTVDQAVQHLQGKIPELQAWAEVFIKAKPEGAPRVKDLHGKRVKMSVNKLLDVEEHIWSPMYGLKGNIDATVQVTMEDDAGERTLTVPLEIKTGKQENASHRAQTALYTLLLSDRYDVAVAYGILYYVERFETSRIPAIRHEIRHMIMQRNELACYVRERLSLPPMIRNTHTCNRCYAKVPCFLYHKLSEGGDGETSGLRDKFLALTKHLKSEHQTFFRKWDDLLTKEESEMMKFRRELWTMLSHEREKLGRCFANVTLVSESAGEEAGTSKINRFSYRFRKHIENAAFSFAESQIAAGEPVVISDEQGHYALAKGYVTVVSKAFVSVAVDRRLHNARMKQSGFDAESNQTFAGIMDISTPHPPATPSSTARQPMLYRLDKDEYSNGMATIRNNLIELMTADAFHSHDLRSLIVDLTAPRFKPASSAFAITGPASQATINVDQHNAIEKIMAAEDYALVLGMPGTGKTTTIAHIIRALVAKGKSVLLTSYTHTAVDNILLKIKHDGISVLRLGALARIHPEVKEFATLAAEPRATVDELRAAYHDPPVVATTCLGISHPVFSQHTFDYCIVDEASQITLPVCLGPIRMARAFVLVGDHFQLPPLVQNREALKGGLDVSLFKLLSEAHPDAVATLSSQYRMNESIMHLSNELIYNGRLRCGSRAIADRRLELPYYSTLAQAHQTPSLTPSLPLSTDAPPHCPSLASPSCLLRIILSPTSSPPALFLNTDSLVPTSHETRSGPRITNALEASLTTLLVRALLTSGTAPSSIGIITLYRSQLALIKSLLASVPDASAVEAHTADRFQGRDKDVVIVSFVRANESGEVGELLRDWRRVNVAITRAKRKLILIGSKMTLKTGDQLLGRLIGLCGDVDGGLVDLPREWGHDLSTAVARNPTAVPAGGQGEVSTSLTKSKGPPQQPPQQRRTLALLSTNATSPTKRTSPPKKLSTSNKNPAFKAPARVVQGKRPMMRALKTAPVLSDVMREVIGEDVAGVFDPSCGEHRAFSEVI